jgi:hypothetical protein
MPQSIFHIIAENIEGPHIPEQVKETAMKKHKRDEGEGLLPEGEMGGDFRYRIPDRHEPIHDYKLIQAGALGLLKQIEGHIETDDYVIDNRVILGLNRVSKRYHDDFLPGGPAL